MTVDSVVGVIATVLVLMYLVYSLLRPERFS